VFSKSTTPFSGLLKTAVRFWWAQLRLGWRKYLKMIAKNHGCELLTVRVHRGDYVYVFVLVKPRVFIPDIVAVLKCNSARLLFEEFVEIRLRFWGGHLWSEGYAVRTAGVVTSAKIEEYINRS
jgi:putative transposase